MPATRAAMGARGALARRAVLKARAADMAGREEMECGWEELAELAYGVELALHPRFLPLGRPGTRLFSGVLQLPPRRRCPPHRQYDGYLQSKIWK